MRIGVRLHDLIFALPCPLHDGNGCRLATSPRSVAHSLVASIPTRAATTPSSNQNWGAGAARHVMMATQGSSAPSTVRRTIAPPKSPNRAMASPWTISASTMKMAARGLHRGGKGRTHRLPYSFGQRVADGRLHPVRGATLAAGRWTTRLTQPFHHPARQWRMRNATPW